MALDTSRLNKHDAVYHGLMYDVLTHQRLTFRDSDRTVIDTVGLLGPQVEYDVGDGTVPFSQTKPIAWKTQLLPEIVGFMRNENNLSWYLDQGMRIWNANAFDSYRKKLADDDPRAAWKHLEKDSPEFNAAIPKFVELVESGEDPRAGDLGNFYPRQWRSYKGVIEKEFGEEVVQVDQLQSMVDKLRTTPSSRYALVSAWNPIDVEHKTAALSPCHCLYQASIRTDLDGVPRLDLKMYQRSADTLLGVPFNNSQYSLEMSALANILDVEPGVFIHTFGDIHFYTGRGERSEWYKKPENLKWLQEELKKQDFANTLEELLSRLPDEGDYPGYDHVPFAIQQLSRESVAEPPTAVCRATSLDEITMDDYTIRGYDLDKKAPKLEINGVQPKMAS